MSILNINVKKSYSNWIFYIIAFSAFISLNPYIIWQNYSSLFNLVINKIVLIITIFLMVIYIMFSGQKLKKINILCAILIFLFYLFTNLHTYNGGIEFNPGSFFAMLIIMTYIIFSVNDKSKVYRIFSWMFTLSLVPGIIVLIFSLLGIHFKYNTLIPLHPGKAAYGWFYKQYFGAVFLIPPSYNFYFDRLCGMFDEPGLVGTISALLLIIDKYKIKGNKKNIILLIGGICSVSFAFIVLSLLYFLIKNCYYNKFKLILYFVLFFAFFSFISNISTNNEFINQYVIERLQISDTGLQGDNRTTENYDKMFYDYIKTLDSLFGLGTGAKSSNPTMSGSSSYKDIIYDNGIFGFIYLMFWIIIFSFNTCKKNKDCIIFLILFCVSIYQRPQIINIHFMIILFGGIASLNQSNDKRKSIRSNKF